jgi:nucleoside-diphosphate-sugar epimerase
VNVFCTGATGYLGGSIAAHLVSEGHRVTALVRNPSTADEIRRRGMEPVLGTLDDLDLIAGAAANADAVLNAASADHEASAMAMLEAMGQGKTFLHTSGSGIVSTRTAGEATAAVYDESTPYTPSPTRAARVALNDRILATAKRGLRPIIICPSMVYGLGQGLKLHSIQVPWLIDLAKKRGVAVHIGAGRNIWSNVHIRDLVDLYALALKSAPPGALYFAENGENSMIELCQAISRMLGFGGRTASITIEEAIAEWGEKAAQDTMGSNSRVRATRARNELGWSPSAPSLLEEIERGCYVVTRATR